MPIFPYGKSVRNIAKKSVQVFAVAMVLQHRVPGRMAGAADAHVQQALRGGEPGPVVLDILMQQNARAIGLTPARAKLGVGVHHRHREMAWHPA